MTFCDNTHSGDHHIIRCPFLGQARHEDLQDIPAFSAQSLLPSFAKGRQKATDQGGFPLETSWRRKQRNRHLESWSLGSSPSKDKTHFPTFLELYHRWRLQAKLNKPHITHRNWLPSSWHVLDFQPFFSYGKRSIFHPRYPQSWLEYISTVFLSKYHENTVIFSWEHFDCL